MQKFIHKATNFFKWTTLIIAVFSLLYRSTIYWTIPLMPGEPYGMGDILELFFGLLILFAASMSLILGLVLLVVPKFMGKKIGIQAILLAIISVAGWYFLHPLMPRLIE